MAPKLNLNKLRDRLNRHKNKGTKKTGNSNVSPFFNLQEGKNRFRLVAWPDAEEEDGERIPDFKELSFYYNLKFPEKDESGNIKKDAYNKQIWNKAPISCKSRGLRDCVDEMMSDLFNKEGKSEDEIRDDKELAMQLWPTPTYYLLGIDRSREDEGLKIWSISGKTQYENLLDLMLDPEDGPMVLDTSENGFDIEIKVNMVDDPRPEAKGKKKRVIGTPTVAKRACPLSEDPEKSKEIMNDQNFPNPEKIFAKRFLSSEELDEHFDRWLRSTSGEQPDLPDSDGTEVEAPKSENESSEDDEVKEEEKTSSKKKESSKKSAKAKTVDDAFDDLNMDEDEDED